MKVVQELMRHANLSVTRDRTSKSDPDKTQSAERRCWLIGTQGEPNPKLQSLQVIDSMVSAVGFEPMTATA